MFKILISFSILLYLNLTLIGKDKNVILKYDRLGDCDLCLTGIVQKANVTESLLEGKPIFLITYLVKPEKNLLGAKIETEFIEVQLKEKWLQKDIALKILRNLNVVEKKFIFLVNINENIFEEYFFDAPTENEIWAEFLKPYEAQAEKFQKNKNINIKLKMPETIYNNEPFLCTFFIKNESKEEWELRGITDILIKMPKLKTPNLEEFQPVSQLQKIEDNEQKVITLYNNLKSVLKEGTIKLKSDEIIEIKFIMLIHGIENLKNKKQSLYPTYLYFHNKEGIVQLRWKLETVLYFNKELAKIDLEVTNFLFNKNFWHCVDGQKEIIINEQNKLFLTSSIQSIQSKNLKNFLFCFLTFNNLIENDKKIESLNRIIQGNLYGFKTLAESELIRQRNITTEK